MSHENKKISLLKLLNSFPSFLANGEETTAALLGSYLELLGAFRDDDVEAGCLSLRRKGGAFPPSAGDVYGACDREAIYRRKQEDFDAIGRRHPVQTLAPPRRMNWSFKQMADWSLVINGTGEPYVMRVDESGNPLPIPSGYPGYGKHSATYGYLTPKEAQIAKDRKAGKQLSVADNYRNWAAE